MSRVLCLTGMHRSGTSLTASWLQDCGLVIDAGGLVGPAAGNPKGHYEDFEMMLLHRAEFMAQRRRSRGWQLTAPDDLWFSSDRRSEAAELIRNRNARFEQWGWKDPRSLPFLQQWQQLEPDLRVMILWRPVEDVVGSLVRRAADAKNKDFKVGTSKAVSTWIAYNELALKHKRANPGTTLLVPLTRVLQDGEAVIDELKERLDMNLQWSAMSERFEADLLHQGGLGHAFERPWLQSKIAQARTLEAELANSSDR